MQVVTADVTADEHGDAGELIDAVVARYRITIADPAAVHVPRAVHVADQLVLVAPASADAAGSLAMTLEWLEAHGYDDLARSAVTVLNGVSAPMAAQVDKAAGVAAGRCRAIVRVPWDDRLADGRALGTATVHAYTALAGVPVAGLADPAGAHSASTVNGASTVTGRDERAHAGRTRLSVRYFDDRILLTETHAWAYFRVPTISYEFMTGQQREALATNLTVALAGIRMADAEVHLRIAHRSYPAAEWATGLHATSDGGPGWVRLPGRDVPAGLGQGLLDQGGLPRRPARPARRAGSAVRRRVRPVRQRLPGREQALGLNDDAVPAAEIAKWTEQAERVGRALGASSLAARHATADEVAWLFRHALTGTVGEPPPSAARRRHLGIGEIESLVEGEIHNGRTVLRMFHPAGESWAAFLSFSRFPDVMYFPDGEPWLHYADSLPFPVEASLRMKLIPPAKASKDVSRRLAHARDMDAHIREAGADLPLALAEQIEAARLLEHGITKERLPFVYGWHRLDGDRAGPRAVRAPGRGRHRALPGHRHRRGQLDRRPVLAAERVAARRQGPAGLVPAAPAALHDHGRDADRDGRSR